MKRKNKIWTIPKDDLLLSVNSATTLSDILKHYQLDTSSANYVALKTRLKKDNISFEHIKLGLGSNKNKYMPWLHGTINLTDILVENSTYSRTTLKKRLLKENILQNECYECKIGPFWNNKPMSLQIDHINGITNDNRLENLRILCPNCHSQTENFGGKNIKIKSKLEKIKKEKHTKIVWPTKEKLLELLNIYNYVQLGKILGVSDNAIRKHIKNSG